MNGKETSPHHNKLAELFVDTKESFAAGPFTFLKGDCRNLSDICLIIFWFVSYSLELKALKLSY